MGGLRTVLCLCFGLSAANAAAIPSHDDPVRFFATCAGQLSAQMEFQWLMQDPAADQTRQFRATMLELLQAVAPRDPGPELLSWRINAKMAHAALLRRAEFGSRPDDAAWARARAAAAIRTCTGLLIS